MNRFKITPVLRKGLRMYGEKEIPIFQVPGFKNFSLLKGPATEEFVLYASHSIWENKELL